MYVMSSGSRSTTMTAEHEVECVRELETRSFRSCGSLNSAQYIQGGCIPVRN